jgi:hypothetical protein
MICEDSSERASSGCRTCFTRSPISVGAPNGSGIQELRLYVQCGPSSEGRCHSGNNPSFLPSLSPCVPPLTPSSSSSTPTSYSSSPFLLFFLSLFSFSSHSIVLSPFVLQSFASHLISIIYLTYPYCCFPCGQNIRTPSNFSKVSCIRHTVFLPSSYHLLGSPSPN